MALRYCLELSARDLARRTKLDALSGCFKPNRSERLAIVSPRESKGSENQRGQRIKGVRPLCWGLTGLDGLSVYPLGASSIPGSVGELSIRPILRHQVDGLG